jgi:hypothetical protein
MCTEEFRSWAAYSPDDCICQDSKCLNKNIGLMPETIPDIYDFNSCVAAGNPVMESYPRQCAANGITYVEEILEPGARHVCTPEESSATACNLMYSPVCGEIVLNMGKTIYQTFGNGCAACAAMKTVAYTPGECLDLPEDICYDSEGNYMKLEDAIAAATASECGGNLKTKCVCPEGYIKDGDACNPSCYYSDPACMMPSLECPNPVTCNSYTGTYWIDMTTKKAGCSPGCVVNVKTGKAEINWRCTGLMSEPGSAG